MKRIGFYSGSFDPVTLGHTDVIERACRLVDELVIGIGVHPDKAPLFSAEERVVSVERIPEEGGEEGDGEDEGDGTAE